MVDENVCYGKTCDEVNAIIDMQTWRINTCGACPRVGNNANAALNVCR